MAEAWEAHSHGPRPYREAAILDALDAVSLDVDRPFLRRYPGELSVGQAQRVLIAMAILHRPALLIADEATSALDALTQSEILRLFARLNREMSMAILYISHDLLSIAALCGRVAILHEGEIVEFAPVERHLRASRASLHAPPDRSDPRRARGARRSGLWTFGGAGVYACRGSPDPIRASVSSTSKPRVAP